MDYNSGTSSRRASRKSQNQPTYGFETFDQSSQYYNQYYGNNYGYDQQQFANSQLFEGTSSPQYHQQPDFFQQSMPQQQSTSFAPGGCGINSNLINQQVLMAAGQQLLSNPMATAAFEHYSQTVVTKGKSWIGQNVKYYFAVDTGYVLKKLLLIFFPFTHKDWSVKYNSDEAVAPRDDLNAPDLYIPSMAFVTYVLVAGYLLGLQSRFSPEQLGIQASSALAWLIVEVVCVMMALYLLSIASTLGFFHLISFCSYKFVCIVGALLASLPFKSVGYYGVLFYSSISLGFFLMRSLHIAIQTSPASSPSRSKEPRNGLYIVILICLLQPFLMYVLTRHLLIVST